MAGNVRTREFRELFDRLPEQIRRVAEGVFAQFERDPSHPALRHHTLDDSGRGRHRKGSASVSVTMKYRAIYVPDGDTNVWYWIGTHNDYDNFTGGK